MHKKIPRPRLVGGFFILDNLLLAFVDIVPIAQLFIVYVAVQKLIDLIHTVGIFDFTRRIDLNVEPIKLFVHLWRGIFLLLFIFLFHGMLWFKLAIVLFLRVGGVSFLNPPLFY